MAYGYGEFFLQLRVETLENYLELIREAVLFGVHNPHTHGQPDENGMSLVDQFYKLERVDAEEYLGLLIGTAKTWTEDDQEWEEDEELNESTVLTLDSNCRYPIPEKGDFPILITWWYQNGFDRTGKLGMRLFHWESLTTIKDSKGYLRTKADAAEYQQLCEYQTKREQYLKDERDAHDWS